MTAKAGKLLAGINSPEDLKKLAENQLVELAAELREFILDIVSVHPGHLGASLGVVELTIALHYVFNTPYDRLIWDVGHQAYGHKILTGRRDQFHTNRQFKGISGFPSIAESEYDTFGTGHASTSISAALGLAVSSRMAGETDRQHIAVIGDGAMTGGMAMEALNNAGVSNANILVILNDNGFSIDKNVGLVNEYLARIATSVTFDQLKVSNLQNKKVEKAIELQKNNLPGSIKFKYFGPINGNDVNTLVNVLSGIREIEGPKLLHIITKKGKGFEKAEQEQVKYHAPGHFDRITGELISKQDSAAKVSYQYVFGKTMLELAKINPKIIAITPAMPTGSSLIEMKETMPGRVFDVGIAEQHAVTFAAGLAVGKLKPFCVIYSTFLQRAFDQLIHDVALQKLPVVFCIDRAGLVGEDGPTHHGCFDLSYLRLVPGMVVAAPMNEVEMRNLLFTASTYDEGPFSIRYPRSAGVVEKWDLPFEMLELGKGRQLRQGAKVAIISLGHAGNFAEQACNMLAAEGLSSGLFDMRFLKPADENLLHFIFNNYEYLITVEDGSVIGGLGEMVVSFKNKYQFHNHIETLGIPDRFIEHGSLQELHKLCAYDANSIFRLAENLFRIS